MMIQATELAERILAELEDTGFDNLHAILNTVIQPSGSSDEIEELRNALSAITEGNLGYLNLEWINPQKIVRLNNEQSAKLIQELADWFRFDAEERYWVLGNGDPLKDPAPVLFLTRPGIEMARKILDARGYHWWMARQK